MLSKRKELAFQYNNAIEGLLRQASERVWKADSIEGEDRFLLAALIDAALATGQRLGELIEDHMDDVTLTQE